MHAVAELHETASSAARRFPGERGCVVDHALPSHRSANGRNPAPVPRDTRPTAMQALAELHDTPLKLVRVAPGGSGIGATVQVAPVHCAESGAGASPGPYEPTAMQSN
jgi:hypothetical protein